MYLCDFMEFDNDKFIEGVRARLKLVMKIQKRSMASLSRDAGGNEGMVKQFLNGRTNNVTILTLLGWARVLDIPYTALVGENPNVDMTFSDGDKVAVIPVKASDVIDEYEHGIIDGTTEIGLQRKAGENLGFVRTALGQSSEDFAKAAFIPVATLNAYEAGKAMIPPLVVVRLCKAFGFTADDIYN